MYVVEGTKAINNKSKYKPSGFRPELILDGMLVHHRVSPSIKFASTLLYTCVEGE